MQNSIPVPATVIEHEVEHAAGPTRPGDLDDDLLQTSTWTGELAARAR